MSDANSNQPRPVVAGSEFELQRRLSCAQSAHVFRSVDTKFIRSGGATRASGEVFRALCLERPGRTYGTVEREVARPFFTQTEFGATVRDGELQFEPSYNLARQGGRR